ncbi:hypothetical protein [Streptomyces sp. NPDC048623]|uniref:hypothetical protein n=1 Tax=Streptomyces sp. NPDC048623 TaxID=3155761 RepID=UPI00341BC1A5
MKVTARVLLGMLAAPTVLSATATAHAVGSADVHDSLVLPAQPAFFERQPVFTSRGANEDNVNTHADAGLLQVVTSGAEYDLAKVGILSN